MESNHIRSVSATFFPDILRRYIFATRASHRCIQTALYTAMIFARSVTLVHSILVVRHTSFAESTLQASNAVSRALFSGSNKISSRVRSCIKRNLSTIPRLAPTQSAVSYRHWSYLATSNYRPRATRSRRLSRFNKAHLRDTRG